MSSRRKTAIVTTVIGMLPAASRRTMRQSIVWLNPCTRLPAVFVTAAYSRSVPTAAAGLIPNTRMSRGVISEPPPTPVKPTRAPTRKPEIA